MQRKLYGKFLLASAALILTASVGFSNSFPFESSGGFESSDNFATSTSSADNDAGDFPRAASCGYLYSEFGCSGTKTVRQDECMTATVLKEILGPAHCTDEAGLSFKFVNCVTFCAGEGYSKGECKAKSNSRCNDGVDSYVGYCNCSN